nr:hypothetical protein [uncultured Tolumonas sp.]
MKITVESVNDEIFLRIPAEILNFLGCHVGDKFYVGAIQPETILLMLSPESFRSRRNSSLDSNDDVADFEAFYLANCRRNDADNT